jgi:hypothetical protein
MYVRAITLMSIITNAIKTKMAAAEFMYKHSHHGHAVIIILRRRRSCVHHSPVHVWRIAHLALGVPLLRVARRVHATRKARSSAANIHNMCVCIYLRACIYTYFCKCMHIYMYIYIYIYILWRFVT